MIHRRIRIQTVLPALLCLGLVLATPSGPARATDAAAIVITLAAPSDGAGAYALTGDLGSHLHIPVSLHSESGFRGPVRLSATVTGALVRDDRIRAEVNPQYALCPGTATLDVITGLTDLASLLAQVEVRATAVAGPSSSSGVTSLALTLTSGLPTVVDVAYDTPDGKRTGPALCVRADSRSVTLKGVDHLFSVAFIRLRNATEQRILYGIEPERDPLGSRGAVNLVPSVGSVEIPLDIPLGRPLLPGDAIDITCDGTTTTICILNALDAVYRAVLGGIDWGALATQQWDELFEGMPAALPYVLAGALSSVLEGAKELGSTVIDLHRAKFASYLERFLVSKSTSDEIFDEMNVGKLGSKLENGALALSALKLLGHAEEWVKALAAEDWSAVTRATGEIFGVLFESSKVREAIASEVATRMAGKVAEESAKASVQAAFATAFFLIDSALKLIDQTLKLKSQANLLWLRLNGQPYATAITLTARTGGDATQRVDFGVGPTWAGRVGSIRAEAGARCAFTLPLSPKAPPASAISLRVRLHAAAGSLVAESVTGSAQDDLHLLPASLPSSPSIVNGTCDLRRDRNGRTITPGLYTMTCEAFDGQVSGGNLMATRRYPVWVVPNSGAVPGIVSDLTVDVSRQIPGALALQWSELADSAAVAALELQRREGVVGPFSTRAYLAPLDWHMDETSLVVGRTYQYRARVWRTDGRTGAWSATVTAKPVEAGALQIQAFRLSAPGAATQTFSSMDRMHVELTVRDASGAAADPQSMEATFVRGSDQWRMSLTLAKIGPGRYAYDTPVGFTELLRVGAHRIEGVAYLVAGVPARQELRYVVGPVAAPPAASVVIPSPQDNRVRLAWSAAEDPDEWWIYRSEVEGRFLASDLLIKVPGTYRNHTDATAVNGHSYYYKFEAHKAGAKSASTLSSVVSPRAGPGLALRFLAIGPASIADGGYVTLAHIRLDASVSSVVLDTIRGTRTGSMVDADVKGFYLFSDWNGNGTVDASDALINGSEAHSAADDLFNCGHGAIVVEPGTPRFLLLRAFVNQTTPVGRTLGVRIDPGDVDEDSLFLPADQAKYKVREHDVPASGFTSGQRTMSTGDIFGPVVQVTGAPAVVYQAGQTIRIVCTISDAAPTGITSHAVARVEASVDQFLAQGQGAAFTSGDGAFDSETENGAYLDISTSGWADGAHQISIRAADSLSNWGEFTTITVYRSVAAKAPMATARMLNPGYSQRVAVDGNGKCWVVLDVLDPGATVWVAKWDPVTKSWDTTNGVATVVSPTNLACRNGSIAMTGDGRYAVIGYSAWVVSPPKIGFYRYGALLDTQTKSIVQQFESPQQDPGGSGPITFVQAADGANRPVFGYALETNPSYVDGTGTVVSVGPSLYERQWPAGSPGSRATVLPIYNDPWGRPRLSDTIYNGLAVVDQAWGSGRQALYVYGGKVKYVKQASGSWGTPADVASCDTPAQQPSVVNSGSATVAAWVHGFDVWAMRITSTGAGTAYRVTTNGRCGLAMSSAQTHLTLDAQDRVYLAYEEDGHTYFRVSRDAGATWGAARPLAPRAVVSREPFGSAGQGRKPVFGWLEGDGGFLTAQARDVAVDDAAPSASILAPAPGASLPFDASVRIAVAGNLRGWRLEGGVGANPSTWSVIASHDGWEEGTFDVPWDATAVPDGAVTMRLTVLSDVGNDVVKTIALSADRTPPTIDRVTVSPSYFSPVAAGAGPLSATVTVSGQTRLDYWIEADRGELVTELAGPSWDGRDSSGTVVGDGLYWFVVRAYDATGNNILSATPFLVDGTSPVIDVRWPSGVGPLQVAPLVFPVLGSQSDNLASGCAIEVRQAGALVRNVTRSTPGHDGSLGWVDARSLADGTYDLRIRCSDLAGNETSLDHRFVVRRGGTSAVFQSVTPTPSGNLVLVRVRGRRLLPSLRLSVDGGVAGIPSGHGTSQLYVTSSAIWAPGRPVVLLFLDQSGRLVATATAPTVRWSP